jgi:cyclopropane fatty-acyl-phospholipid synthase-like methyltransferase
MNASSDSQERFQRRYATSGVSAMIEAEREVLGSDYQANGYTTLAQADRLGDALRLDAGMRLLDIGSGCGWPGLYLAKRHGCTVVSLDPIGEGSNVANERARRDALSGRHWGVRGHGSALPFVRRSFEAVVHADVLC